MILCGMRKTASNAPEDHLQMKEFFQHDMALVESEKIGKDTRIWAFAHILPGATIGSNCNICDHVFIENDVIIGNRVTVSAGR